MQGGVGTPREAQMLGEALLVAGQADQGGTGSEQSAADLLYPTAALVQQFVEFRGDQ